MEEKSNIEILKDYARSTHKEIFFKEIPYPKSGIRTFQKYRREVYLPLNPDKSSFMVWFSDAYGEIGYSKVFCGVFTVIPLQSSASILIRKKNVLDKINIFSGKSPKTGKDGFDSKTIMTGNLDQETKRFISSARIQKQIVSALEMEDLIQISINHFNVDFVPELKGKTCLGIVNPQNWYLEKKEIDLLLKHASPFENTYL